MTSFPHGQIQRPFSAPTAFKGLVSHRNWLPPILITFVLVALFAHPESAQGVEDPLSPTAQETVLPSITVAWPQGDQISLIDATGDRIDYEILQSQVEQLSPSQSLLKLTIRMTNGKPFPVNFWNESFRLTLGAETLAPSNMLNEVVDGNSTQTGEVAFTIPSLSTTGSLMFNVGDVEDQIPLVLQAGSDLPSTPLPPVASSSPVGLSVTWPQGTQISLVDATGDRSDYEILQSQVERLSPSQSLLKLTVRMTNGKSFPINFWADSFRLTLGADILAPSNALNEVVDGNSTQTGEVAFTIPNAPASGSLAIRLSDVEDELTLQIK